MSFYVDREITRQLSKKDNNKYVPSAYQMVYFSMSAGTWGGNVAQSGNSLPAYSYFDYCRVYQTDNENAYYFFGDEKKLIQAEDRKGKY